MTLERILLFIGVFSCLVLLGRIVFTGLAQARGWAAICVAILAVAAASWFLIADQAGWLVGPLWAVLVAIPALATRLAMVRTMQQRFASARFHARIARVLHPFDGSRMWPDIIAALDLAHRGEAERAAAALSRLTEDPRVSKSALPVIQAQIFRNNGDWRAILALSESADTAARTALLPMRVRALGETGQLREMVATFRTGRFGQQLLHRLCLLFVLAFCGRRNAVTDLLSGPLAMLDAGTKTFWRDTAMLTSGADDGEARAELSALAAAGGHVGRMAQQRLDTPLVRPPDVLTPDDWQALDKAEAELRHDTTLGTQPYAGWRSAYVVIGLVALILIVFAVEVWEGGSQSARTLYDLGAMWPPAILEEGEWWRLATAPFLHFGPVHLGLNLLSLVVIGLPTERILGHWRTLIVYLGSAIGSTGAVLLLIQLGLMPSALLVGASGAIFGLIGAQVALLIRAWRVIRSRLAAGRLLNLGLIIMLQAIFDLFTPQVSFSAHASGLLIGLVLTAAVAGAGSNGPASPP